MPHIHTDKNAAAKEMGQLFDDCFCVTKGKNRVCRGKKCPHIPKSKMIVLNSTTYSCIYDIGAMILQNGNTNMLTVVKFVRTLFPMHQCTCIIIII